jgi:AcrR family transcriptional regulator
MVHDPGRGAAYRHSSGEPPPSPARQQRRGRPRSDRAHRAILDAFLTQLIQEGFADLRLEHVAAQAGVGKATIYRRWPSKEALALDLLMQLAAPHIGIEDVGDTRAELVAAITNAIADVDVATELLVGPVYFRLMFGGELTRAFAEQVADAVLRGHARVRARTNSLTPEAR